MGRAAVRRTHRAGAREGRGERLRRARRCGDIEVLAADDAWLAEYAAFVRSIRGSVASGDLTEAEGDRLIARQRRHAEAETARRGAADHATAIRRTELAGAADRSAAVRIRPAAAPMRQSGRRLGL